MIWVADCYARWLVWSGYSLFPIDRSCISNPKNGRKFQANLVQMIRGCLEHSNSQKINSIPLASKKFEPKTSSFTASNSRKKIEQGVSSTFFLWYLKGCSKNSSYIPLLELRTLIFRHLYRWVSSFCHPTNGCEPDCHYETGSPCQNMPFYHFLIRFIFYNLFNHTNGP